MKVVAMMGGPAEPSTAFAIATEYHIPLAFARKGKALRPQGNRRNTGIAAD